jgi:pimeloyl-ACP methyl ester carboxylesterase
MDQVKVPVMGIYGKKDLIVDPRQNEVLKQYAPHSKIAYFTESGHFPMMDEPERFYKEVREFLYNG